MHCGSSLSTQTAAATATPTPPVQSQPITQTCIACHAEVPREMAFCTNCGQSMRVSTTPGVSATPLAHICANCGLQNNPGVNFCAGCGRPLSNNAGIPVPQTNYAQPPQYSQPYSQYPQQAPQYGAQYPQQPMMKPATNGASLSHMHVDVTSWHPQLPKLSHESSKCWSNTSEHAYAKPAGRTWRTFPGYWRKHGYGCARWSSSSHWWRDTTSRDGTWLR